MLRRDEESGIKRALGFEVEGNRGRGRPRLSWREQVDKDRVRVGMDTEGAENREEWRSGVRRLRCG